MDHDSGRGLQRAVTAIVPNKILPIFNPLPLLALLLGLALGLFALLWVMNHPLGQIAELQVVAVATMGIFGAGLYRPLHARLFTGKAYQIESGASGDAALMHQLYRDLMQTRTPDESSVLLAAVLQRMGFPSALLLWAEEEWLSSQSEFGVVPAYARLHRSGSLATLLSSAPVLHPRASLLRLLNESELPQGESDLLWAPSSQWWLPLVGSGGLRAVLVLGKRQDDRSIEDNETDLLLAMVAKVSATLENARLLKRIGTTSRVLEETHQAMVRTLVAAMQARDDSTSYHCRALATWAEGLARRLALPSEETSIIRLAALLHDVGKLGIPDAILLKPGALTDEEWRVMRQHPALGEAILAPAEHLSAVAPLVGSHHERWDGSGYPRGLVGEEIPLGARIIAVVDSYSAMTCDRVYRAAICHEEAIAELRREAGRLFDPLIVRHFEELMAQELESAPATPTL